MAVIDGLEARETLTLICECALVAVQCLLLVSAYIKIKDKLLTGY